LKKEDLDLLISIVPDHTNHVRTSGWSTSLLHFFADLDNVRFYDASWFVVINYHTLTKLAAEAGEVDFSETVDLPYRRPLGRE
jgi:hypothetical protein